VLLATTLCIYTLVGVLVVWHPWDGDGMNDHTFAFWTTVLGAALTGVLALGGVYLGAVLALRNQRHEAHEERQREAAAYLHGVAWTAQSTMMVLGRSSWEQVARDLVVNGMGPQAWRLTDTKLPTAIAECGNGLIHASYNSDVDEAWRIATLLLKLGALAQQRMQGKDYGPVPRLNDWTTPPNRSMPLGWGTSPRPARTTSARRPRLA
jgi:hypothetical protein